MRAEGDRVPPDVVGQRVAHYEVVAEIGRGGMGVVFRARDIRLGRFVALKCPWPALAAQPAIVERFLREARSAALLSHPNIVPVFEVLRSGGLPWIAMELVEGGSMRHLLKEKGPVPLGQAVRWVEALADALHVAHKQGIVHRDINPNNVLLRAGSWPLVTDFGLARTLDAADFDATTATLSDALTAAGQIVGTRHYMPPEQLLGRRIDHRADIFALGAVLYELCTGRRAFDGADAGLDVLLDGAPPSVSGLLPERSDAEHLVSGELDRIVSKALAKRPEGRYQDAQILATELGTLRSRLDASVYAGQRPAPSPGRRPAFLAAGALVVLAAAAFVLVTSAVRREPRHGLPGGTPRQVTSDPGWEADPAISPDGSLIAYAAGTTGNADIWVTDVQGGSRVRLTADPANDESPTWLPDGSAVAFESDRGGLPGIWKVPRLGGTATLIAANASDPAVSPDGTRIAFSRPNPAGYLRITVARLDDPGDARTITGDAEGERSHAEPSWSPDGRWLCYADARNLWVVDVDRGSARRLTEDNGVDFAPAFSPDGRLVVFSSFRDGTRALWQVPLAGGPPERLTIGTGPESQASLSADGARIVYSTHVDDYDVMVRDLQSGRVARIGSVLVDASPAFAPDGTALAFVSTRRGGLQDLWVQKLTDGMPAGEPERLTDLTGSVGTPAWSPDGHWIAFKREVAERRETWVLPAVGGAAARFSDGTGRDIHPTWSPDGRTIAFASERAGGVHIYLAPVANGLRTGPDRQVTSAETTDILPAWAPDGQRIAHVAGGSSEQQVRIVTVRDGTTRVVTSGPAFGRIVWGRGNAGLWFAGIGADGVARLWRMSAGAARASPAVDDRSFEAAATPGEFDVSRDGRLIAFTRRDVRGDIWLLEGRGTTPR